MPTPCHLTLIGESQGEIEGGCEHDGREGTIIVQSVDHVVEIPTDSRGISTGRRVHRPMTITKEIDCSTPMLYQALCTGERLTEVTLDWYRVEESGGQELYYTVYMQNVIISKLHPWMPNTLDQKNSGFRHMEDVSFMYEKIRWTWVQDGIEFDDTWGEMFES
jgi:type VI secretion system secreted protein Hcp